jgi:hypothetical protein
LADVVAPATPRTIYLLHVDKPRNNWLLILGPLASIRRLNLGTAISTLIFVFSSLSDSISHQNLSMDIYSLDGLESLQVLIFLMSAAAMGGCFQSMFIAHTFIQKGTYDPRFESSYWMRIGLGIIAGLVLSQMIPIGPGPETGDAATAPASSASVFGKPLLSLLGGFSATLVYTILQRLVETVESLFSQRQAAPTAVAANSATAGVPVVSAPDASVPAPPPAMPEAAVPIGTNPTASTATTGPLTAAAASVAALAAATTAITTATAATLDTSTLSTPASPEAPLDPAAQPAEATTTAESSDTAPSGQVDVPAVVQDATTLKSA